MSHNKVYVKNGTAVSFHQIVVSFWSVDLFSHICLLIVFDFPAKN